MRNLIIFFSAFPLLGIETGSAAEPIDFEQQIAPLLAAHCLECHAGAEPKAGLDLSRHEAALRGGENGVVLVPGDHDAGLLLTNVGRRAVEAFQAPGRVELAGEGFWRSSDGLIHVEHGHQMEMRAEQFEGWPRPVVSRRGLQHLARPWGEQVVQPLFDDLESRFPVVDNPVSYTHLTLPTKA